MPEFENLVQGQMEIMDKLLYLQAEIERCQKIEKELAALEKKAQLLSDPGRYIPEAERSCSNSGFVSKADGAGDSGLSKNRSMSLSLSFLEKSHSCSGVAVLFSFFIFKRYNK